MFFSSLGPSNLKYEKIPRIRQNIFPLKFSEFTIKAVQFL